MECGVPCGPSNTFLASSTPRLPIPHQAPQIDWWTRDELVPAATQPPALRRCVRRARERARAGSCNGDLERVREGNPREVSKGEHEAETVGRDVHSGEDRLREGTQRRGGVKGGPTRHAGRHGTMSDCGGNGTCLLIIERVDHCPADQPRPQLAAGLEVEQTQARVQRAADEKVVDRVARVAALGQHTSVSEGDGVAVERDDSRERARRDGELQVVVVQPAQAHAELRQAVDACSERDPKCEVAVDRVLEPGSVAQHDALHPRPGQQHVQCEMERCPAEDHRRCRPVPQLRDLHALEHCGCTCQARGTAVAATASI
eukprot:scaffold269_cov123-Isochrysis_galbana.AAC.16